LASSVNYSKKSDEDLIAEVKRFLRDSEEAHDDWRVEARELYDLVAGHQWDEVTKAQMKEQLRPLAAFNVAGKYIDAVQGLQINNRQQVKYLPRQMGDAKVNELMTGAADWARQEGDAEDEESEAFYDTIVCGMGWVETSVEMDMDPDGMIDFGRRDPLEMYWDRRARKRNLVDARRLARVCTKSREEIEERWPDKADELGTDNLGVEPDDVSTGNHLNDPDLVYERNDTKTGFQRSYTVTEYQYWVLETKIEIHSQSGMKEFTPAQAKRVRGWLDQNGLPYQVRRRQERCYYRAFLAGSVVLEHEKSPYQEGFTYQCITGKRDRNTNTWYGIARALKDPQLWLNKFFSQILHIINANAKGGIMAERGAFEDPRAAESTWARPDAITWLEQGALSGVNGSKIQEKPMASYPQGMDRLMEFAMRALPETSGLSMELMGMADRMQPGVLEHQRKQAAITIIAWAFDSMRRYYKLHGRQLAYYIREYISDGRLIRINGQEGMQYVPLLRDPESMRYDIIVDEAPTSPNMKERVWAILTEMLPTLLQTGIPIPPDIIKYSPLPEDLQQAWSKMLQKGPSPEQQQQAGLALQKLQAETQKTAAQVKETESKTVLNMAKARESAADAGAKMAGA